MLVRLLAIFESRGIGVLSCSYESDNAAFAATLVLELKNNSDSETLTLVEKLMDTKVVSSVEFSPLKGRKFASFRFPIVILPGERGVIVQPQLLMNGLAEDAKQEEAITILEGGRSYGHSFAKLLHERKTGERDTDIMIQSLKVTGWGIGECKENEKGDITFIMKDPVFGLDSEHDSESRFLVGMIQGMIEEIFSRPMSLQGDRFDGKTNSLVIKLTKRGTSN